jgi:hypothetical protein
VVLVNGEITLVVAMSAGMECERSTDGSSTSVVLVNGDITLVVAMSAESITIGIDEATTRVESVGVSQARQNIPIQ